LDEIRNRLISAGDTYRSGKGNPPRLTISGLVARLLQLDYFRTAGFTPFLFREALFTQLLEANIAATRLTMQSLARPLQPSRDAQGQIVCPTALWRVL